jgi:hypothetical protein
MPLTSDASANIAELAKAHPEWDRKRQVAAGLNAAREKGADIPEPRKRKQHAQAAALRD